MHLKQYLYEPLFLIFSSIPEGEETFLHVMGADVDGEHVGAGHGHREHPGLGVHAAAQVIPGPTEGQILLPTHVIVLERLCERKASGKCHTSVLNASK